MTSRRRSDSACTRTRPLRSSSPAGIPYGEANNAQGASIGRVLTDVYYIAQGTGTNNRAQTPWSLWRKTSEDAPVELIEGVERLRVRFGIDTTPNNLINAANRYVTYDQVGGERDSRAAHRR